MRELTPTEIREFRSGFHPLRPARWVNAPLSDSGAVNPDVSGCLAELQTGRREFTYPGHDPQVLSLLQQIVTDHGVTESADVGCAGGAFPAMHLYAGVKHVTVFEVRPLTIDDPRVTARVEDLTYGENLRPEYDLISCLSTIEHVGLGRYGDPIDPWGDVKMAANLRKLLRPGGHLLISFPTGRGTVVYNRHRIYNTFRRNQLFSGLEQVDVRSDRSPAQRVLHEAQKLVRPGDRSRQPVWLLRKS